MRQSLILAKPTNSKQEIIAFVWRGEPEAGIRRAWLDAPLHGFELESVRALTPANDNEG
jgi:hypothetical protein